MILSWFVDKNIVNAAMNGTIIDECHVEVRPEKVSSSCLDENVCIETCRKYFSHDGWTSIPNVIEAIRKNPYITVVGVPHPLLMTSIALQHVILA